VQEQQPRLFGAFGPDGELIARPPLLRSSWAPASSTMSAVLSVDPPSTTITSRTSPSTAAGTSAVSVAASVASAFKVGMMMEIISPSAGQVAAH
jgi:hypothetical protein